MSCNVGSWACHVRWDSVPGKPVTGILLGTPVKMDDDNGCESGGSEEFQYIQGLEMTRVIVLLKLRQLVVQRF